MIVAALLLAALSVVPASASDSPVRVPAYVVERIPFDITLEADGLEHVPFSLMIIGDGEAVYTHNGIIPATIRNVRVPAGGDFEIVFNTAGETWEHTFRSIPGWLTLLPPLLAIFIALVFRQVHVALFMGIWAGAIIVKDYNPVTGFFWVVQQYVVDSLAGSSGWDHTSIAIFTLLLGGLVGVVSANGGAAGIVRSVSRLATSPVRGQVAAWLMGVLIFFDDYTNTLIVGNTMRPITDKLRISREKLSYIVDSTAAPVTAIAVITSWVGFEISLIKDAFESVGMLDRNPFGTFLESVPYSAYPILTLIFVFFVARLGRDFGPMLHAERRARAGGGVLAPGAEPIADVDSELKQAGEGVPLRWHNAVIPIGVVICGTVWGLIATGRAEVGADASFFSALRSGNSFVALLWSSFAGGVVAIVLTISQRILGLRDTMHAWVAGIKAMTPAIVILVLAWCIGQVCQDIHTADYLVSQLSDVLAPQLLPLLIFLIAAAVSFSTGTSWGTMTILTPLTIPLVIQVGMINELTAGGIHEVLLSSIAAILSGAVFGDHCSPISDTTIMSSMASGSDHIDHVRTQLPYALTTAGLSLALFYVPVALGVPMGVALALSVLAVIGVVRGFGKKVEDVAPQEAG